MSQEVDKSVLDKSKESYSDCDEFHDCVFIIDGEEVSSNKLKLTSNSPVFEKMFFGEMASDRITITDITLEDFCQMLEFTYTKNVKIESVLQAWSLFYIAHKYLLSDFAKACVTFIQEHITMNNLILNYEYAEVYQIEDLQKVCLNIIQIYIRGVLNDICYYHMKPSSILRILEQPTLNISNEELVNGILQWAIIECDMQSISLTAQNVLYLLSSLNILQHLINLDFEIAHKSEKLILECSKQIKNLKDPNVPFKYYTKKHWCTFCKCRRIYKISGRMVIRTGDVLISNVSVSQDIYLFGLVVSTEDKHPNVVQDKYNGAIKIQISQIDDPKFTIVTTVSKFLPYETLIYVPLSDIVLLENNKMYSVKVNYTNFDKNVKYSSVLCNYMSNKLCDDKGNTIFSFDELCGSVIKGLSFYPA